MINSASFYGPKITKVFFNLSFINFPSQELNTKVRSFMKYPMLFLFIPVIFSGITVSAQQTDTRPAETSIQELRNVRVNPSANTTYYITDAGKRGNFICDPGDKITPDDSIMNLVSANGVRFKRDTEQGLVNVRWFGASGNGGTDDWYSLQKAINYVINTPSSVRTLYFPPGTYKISKPLIIARRSGNAYLQSSISLVGPANSKSISAGYAIISAAFNNTFAIGIQSGKGVLIKDLAFAGQFTFPNRLNPIQVDTLSFEEWTDGVTRQNPLSPYSGIVIDPFSDSTVYPKNSDMYPGLHSYYPAGMRRGGSTAVQIVGCSVQNFIVGVMVTPSNQQNGELIDVIDCDISGNKVGYAMGQAQSKECHVNRIKCWQPCHTLFDNITYGIRHGDGAGVPMVDGVNIASAVKQLCRIWAKSFSGTFRNVYAEGLFRLGFAGGDATLSFEDCQFDFATQEPGLPYPDFYILGSGATFHNCMLRLYAGVPGARLILSGTDNFYEGGVTNAPPVSVNLDNNIVYPNPSFSNVRLFYSGGVLGRSNRGAISAASAPFSGSNGKGIDPVYFGNEYQYIDKDYGVSVLYRLTYNDTYERTLRLTGTPVIHANKSRWTAYFRLAKISDRNLLQPGDFILTSGLSYQDQYTGNQASTYPVGFVKTILHDTVFLDNLAYGIKDGMTLSLWADYFVNSNPPLTGNIAAGSNQLVNVQGQFPAIGDRPDAPMLPIGTYVTAVDPGAKTVSFSSTNSTGRSFTDYTFMNGYPTIEMYSPYDLPVLQKYAKTLIGGATFYRYDAVDINTHDNDYLINGWRSPKYKNLNTNIKGDTSLHRFRYVPLSDHTAGQ